MHNQQIGINNSNNDNETNGGKKSSKSQKKQGTKDNTFQNLQKDLRKDQRDLQYTLYVITLLKQLNYNFKEFQMNRKFTLKNIIKNEQLSQEVQQQIINALFNKQQNKQIKTYDLWYQNKTEVQVKGQIYQIIGMLNNYIQIQKSEGDFDLVLTVNQSQDVKNKINTFLYQKQRDSQFEHNVWIIQDYLNVQKYIKISPQEQFNNPSYRYFFELKSNPFRQNENDNINSWSQKSCIQQKVNSLLKIIKKGNQQKIKQIQERGPFQQRFLIRLLQNNMLKNISQIIKEIYAAIHEFFKLQKQVQFHRYLSMRSKNEISRTFQVIKKRHPIIIFYYVVNGKVSKQKFKLVFDFFKPLLSHLFIHFRAVFHVVGMTQKNGAQTKYDLYSIMQQNKKRNQQYKKQMARLTQKIQCQLKQRQKQKQSRQQMFRQQMKNKEIQFQQRMNQKNNQFQQRINSLLQKFFRNHQTNMKKRV